MPFSREEKSPVTDDVSQFFVEKAGISQSPTQECLQRICTNGGTTSKMMNRESLVIIGLFVFYGSNQADGAWHDAKMNFATLEPGGESRYTPSFVDLERLNLPSNVLARVKEGGLFNRPFKKQTLWEGSKFFSDAACLDGTKPVFYVSKGIFQNRVLIMFGDGRTCFSDRDCAQRSFVADVGSSTYFPDSLPSNLKNSTDNVRLYGQGILSTNHFTNFIFSFYTRIFIPTCSSDVFTGNAKYEAPLEDCFSPSLPPPPFTPPQCFQCVEAQLDDLPACQVLKSGAQNITVFQRGRVNLDAVMDTLVNQYGIGHAKKVLLAGASGGGVAAVLHADYIRRSYLSDVEKFKVLVLSGSKAFKVLGYIFPGQNLQLDLSTGATMPIPFDPFGSPGLNPDIYQLGVRTLWNGLDNIENNCIQNLPLDAGDSVRFQCMFPGPVIEASDESFFIVQSLVDQFFFGLAVAGVTPLLFPGAPSIPLAPGFSFVGDILGNFGVGFTCLGNTFPEFLKVFEPVPPVSEESLEAAQKNKLKMQFLFSYKFKWWLTENDDDGICDDGNDSCNFNSPGFHTYVPHNPESPLMVENGKVGVDLAATAGGSNIPTTPADLPSIPQQSNVVTGIPLPPSLNSVAAYPEGSPVMPRIRGMHSVRGSQVSRCVSVTKHCTSLKTGIARFDVELDMRKDCACRSSKTPIQLAIRSRKSHFSMLRHPSRPERSNKSHFSSTTTRPFPVKTMEGCHILMKMPWIFVPRGPVETGFCPDGCDAMTSCFVCSQIQTLVEIGFSSNMGDLGLNETAQSCDQIHQWEDEMKLLSSVISCRKEKRSLRKTLEVLRKFISTFGEMKNCGSASPSFKGKNQSHLPFNPDQNFCWNDTSENHIASEEVLEEASQLIKFMQGFSTLDHKFLRLIDCAVNRSKKTLKKVLELADQFGDRLRAHIDELRDVPPLDFQNEQDSWIIHLDTAWRKAGKSLVLSEQKGGGNKYSFDIRRKEYRRCWQMAQMISECIKVLRSEQQALKEFRLYIAALLSPLRQCADHYEGMKCIKFQKLPQVRGELLARTSQKKRRRTQINILLGESSSDMKRQLGSNTNLANPPIDSKTVADGLKKCGKIVARIQAFLNDNTAKSSDYIRKYKRKARLNQNRRRSRLRRWKSPEDSTRMLRESFIDKLQRENTSRFSFKNKSRVLDWQKANLDKRMKSASGIHLLIKPVNTNLRSATTIPTTMVGVTNDSDSSTSSWSFDEDAIFSLDTQRSCRG
eukprot:jgi/Bigna1/91537/estExt_fgenesh1_pg.C_1050007